MNKIILRVGKDVTGKTILRKVFCSDDEKTKELMKLGYSCIVERLYPHITQFLEKQKIYTMDVSDVVKTAAGHEVEDGSDEWNRIMDCLDFMNNNPADNVSIVFQGKDTIDFMRNLFPKDSAYRKFMREGSVRIECYDLITFSTVGFNGCTLMSFCQLPMSLISAYALEHMEAA